MRTVLHAGMTKAGSSSIQATLRNLPMKDWVYPDMTPTGNLTGVFTTLFWVAPETHHAAKAQGFDADVIARRKSNLQNKLDRLVEETDKNLIFSAEVISNTDVESLTAARDYFAARSERVEVMAYVRPPVAYMQSAFQQVLKSSKLNTLNLNVVWPKYQLRLGRLDDVFGRENVTLKLFDPAAFVGGDVVQDFCADLGIDIDPAQCLRVNESLSLEATALLFAQRNQGIGLQTGVEGTLQRNNRFIQALSSIGSGKVKFSGAAVAPVIEKNRADIDWIEARLGCTVLDAAATEGPFIETDQDLLDVAANSAGLLNERLAQMLAAQTDDPFAQVLRNVELLRQLSA